MAKLYSLNTIQVQRSKIVQPIALRECSTSTRQLITSILQFGESSIRVTHLYYQITHRQSLYSKHSKIWKSVNLSQVSRWKTEVWGEKRRRGNACSLKLIKTSVFKSFEHMTVRVVSGSSQYHIFIIYRPPPSAVNKLTFTGFMDEFTEFLAEAVMTTGKLLILGDFNIHVNSSSSESNKFQSLLDMYNLSQNVTSPTHNHGHTLDLVITRTDDETINKTAVTDRLISDHSAITLSLNTSRPPRPTKTVTFRSFKKLDRDAFVMSLVFISMFLCYIYLL